MRCLQLCRGTARMTFRLLYSREYAFCQCRPGMPYARPSAGHPEGALWDTVREGTRWGVQGGRA